MREEVVNLYRGRRTDRLSKRQWFRWNLKNLRRIKILLDRVGLERGRSSEERFLKAFDGSFDKPSWFVRMEKADWLDDADGIDAWLLTDYGNIPIQVKSSMTGARSFWKRDLSYIKVIVVHVDDTPAAIRQKLFAIVDGNVDVMRREMEMDRETESAVMAISL